MSSSSKPIIYLFNGGWFRASVWSGVQAALKAKGYEMMVPELLCSATDGSQAGKSSIDEVKNCHRLVEPLMDQGHEFIVAGWSFGSLPAVMVTKGWTVAERQKAGKKGGFKAIIHIAGLAVLEPNVDFLGAWAGGKGFSPYVIAEGVYIPNGLLHLDETLAAEAFFNDQSEEVKKSLASTLKSLSFSQATLETAIPVTLQDLTIPSTYVVLENDQGFATVVQDMIAQSHPATNVVRINSGHCVFLSHEAEIVNVFENVAGQS